MKVFVCCSCGHEFKVNKVTHECVSICPECGKSHALVGNDEIYFDTVDLFPSLAKERTKHEPK